MPELTGQTRTPRFSFAPAGPTSTGDADPMRAGVRESPLITSTRPPWRRAHWYTSMVAKPESTASCRMGNSSPDAVGNASLNSAVSFSQTCGRDVSPSSTR